MVNAVAGLAGEITRLDTLGREQFEPFFLEAGKFQDLLQALINACLGRKDELQRSGAPLYEYPLIPEGEEREGKPGHEVPLPSSTANTVNLTLSSLQVNSLAGSLGDAFGGFAAQTAALADIYSPPPPPGVRAGTVTSRAESATVLEKLSRSASVLHTLDAVRSDMTRTLFFQKSAVENIPFVESRVQQGTLPVFSRGGELPPVPAQTGIARKEPGRTVPSPELPGTMFTTLHGMLRKTGRIADIPLPAKVPIGHPSLLAPQGPASELSAAGYPVTDYREATAPLLPVTEHRTAGAPAHPAMARPLLSLPEYPSVQKKPGRRTARRPGTIPRTGIIEIPSLVPAGAVNLPSEMAARNAEQFNEGIARLSGNGTAQRILPEFPDAVVSPAVRLIRGTDPSSPMVSIPDAFEKIAQYLTYSSDIHQQLVSPLSGGISGGPCLFSIPLPFTVSEGGGGLSPGFILPGKDIRTAEDNPVMNVAVSMMSSEGMRRANFLPLSAAGSSLTPGMPFGNAFSGVVPVSSLYSLERALPLSAGSRGETALPAAGGKNPVNFQNTFNITVTTTARGDEAELRELGRKIGVILSDEMKRYGGLR
ncbi:MAG: hypothetical protein WC379_14585 [Methanoregula sp.]